MTKDGFFPPRLSELKNQEVICHKDVKGLDGGTKKGKTAFKANERR